VSDRVSPAELAHRLEVDVGVLARPGLHCAPEVHRLLGTLETGALRLSLGWASTADDVDRAVEGVDRVVASLTPSPSHAPRP
jgi:cysteine desulfurase / selenocysteine lyase